MFLLAFLFLTSFRGQWNVTCSQRNTIIIPDRSIFAAFLTDFQSSKSFDYLFARMDFFNLSTRYDIQSTRTIGISLNNHSNLVFISLSPPPFENDSKLVNFIEEIIESTHYNESMNTSVIYESIYKSTNAKKEQFFVNVFKANFFDETKKYSPYDLPKAFSGCFSDSYYTVCFYAREFDYVSFIGTHKFFGIIVAFYIIIVYLGWKSLDVNFQADSALHLLSIDSLIQHSGFDFGFAFEIFELMMKEYYNRNLFLFLFCVLIYVYLRMEIRMCSNVWKAKIRELQIVTPLLIQFYAKTFLYISLSFICVKFIDKTPVFSLLYLYSPFIWQILHSLTSVTRKTKDSLFIILISLARLLLLFYFTCYKKNIIGSYSLLLGSFVGLFFIIQAIILLLQNYKGPTFFLPHSMQPEAFDYRARSPPDSSSCAICMNDFVIGDDTMVTPCGHYFHAQCLIRWYKEQPICPVCRSHLPDLPVDIT